MDHILVFNSL